MINTFRSLLKDWAAPFITDSPDANSNHGGETIDTALQAKTLTLGGRLRLQSLFQNDLYGSPEEHSPPFFDSSNVICTFYRKFTLFIAHPDYLIFRHAIRQRNR